MNLRHRPRRSALLLFLGACFLALMSALPLVSAQVQQDAAKKEAPSAAAGAATDAPDFERADRNKDGIVDKSEAGVVPGLSANFERADRNKDGKLDREEYAQGLRILQVRR